MSASLYLGTGVQPGPRLTLPTGGRIATLQRSRMADVLGTINQLAQLNQMRPPRVELGPICPPYEYRKPQCLIS